MKNLNINLNFKFFQKEIKYHIIIYQLIFEKIIFKNKIQNIIFMKNQLKIKRLKMGTHYFE
jgi:hypothetical protein